MYTYQDLLGNDVSISFDVLEEADDVLVIAKFHDAWLFTTHKNRGIEFPGGKGESGESNEETARRETMEETGAELDKLYIVAQYEVSTAERTFSKRVYLANVTDFVNQVDYMETLGPILIAGDLANIVQQKQFSFFMQDEGMQVVIQEAMRQLKTNNWR
ncbi:RNA deprotection pyrophosphohydrolase [Paenilisteria rocourtiae]|uniref:8-oxo-dGTPase n=1 Tax=Listeria rocourtiae TaxID=647910 RepID=A0A4R6ZMS2_9LIST|nr:nucleoside triphosphatase YtkD [Listeria rocourtiae]EUJ44011.1 MutT/NUDIX hydrolase [Listeria rocourtiae FSL F6-920]MBC1604032.1 nucleoside triphosphatase YtkD [Listeria rocourtiae]TDR53454.1 8-oxo-dGTPase [Listeria rocourtiae]